jgi:Carboxypeptidase regulatory-like domain
MSSKRVALLLVALFCLFAVTPSALYSQSTSSGAVTGTVTDPSGAVVPAATVTLTNHGTNASQTATTDGSGRYNFPAVDPGTYSLRVSGKGFRTMVVTGLQVEVAKSNNVDVRLELGQVAETVEVSASGMTELQTQDATVGEVLSGTEMNRLPVNGRSAAQLIFMQPGVSPDVSNAPSSMLFGGGDIGGGQIAGARSEQITFTIDGGDATSDLEGSNAYVSPDKESSAISPVVPVPLDSVEEFRVSTTNANSTFGGSSGGQVSMITKGGTNSFHGTAYEYYEGDALNANGWTNNFDDINKPHTVDNRFGAQTGGPIIKNKFFFSGFYEGRRFHEAQTISRAVPTESLKDGIIEFPDNAGNLIQYNFNPANGALTTACAGASGLGGAACDPRGLGASPVMLSQFALYPTGTNLSLGDGYNTTGFVASVPTPIITDVGKLKLDYKLNDKWSAFVTWQYSKTTRTSTDQVDILNTPEAASGDPYNADFFTFQVQGQLSPSITSVTHGSFLRNWWAWLRTTPEPLVDGTNSALEVGGEGVGGSYSTGKILADPININTQQARSRVWDGHDWFIAQDLTAIHGSHAFQWGGEGRIWDDYHLRTDDVLGGLTVAPTYYVCSITQSNCTNVKVGSEYTPVVCITATQANCLPSGDVGDWQGVYASLMGLLDHSSQIQTTNGQFQPNPLGTPLFDNVRIPSFYTYFQDVWKVTHNLTITMGVNWGVQLAPSEASGKEVVLTYADSGAPIDFNQYLSSRANLLGAGQLYNPTWSLTPVNSLPAPYTGEMRITDWTDIGPRIALAWQVPYKNRIFGDHRTVIRAGYSKIYDRTSAVNQVLSPLLTGGLADADTCSGPTTTNPGGPGGTLAACTNGTTSPLNAYRIGVDGSGPGIPPPVAQPIPFVPAQPFGLFLSAPLNPFITPGYAHAVTFSVQRALPHNLFLELGYIGHFSRNLPESEQLTGADYKMKDPISGQTYAQAFDCLALELRAIAAPSGLNCNTPPGTTTANSGPTEQPFFTNIIGNTNCINYGTAEGESVANCSQLFANDEAYSLTSGDLGGFSAFEANLVALSAGQPIDNAQAYEFAGVTDRGYSDYNAGYALLRKSFSKGLQFQGQWTWSHAIGIQGLNQQYIYSNSSPYYTSVDRGSEPFDHRHTFTGNWYYELPFGKGRTYATGNGVLDRVIGGWETSGIFTFFTGSPICVYADGDYGSFFGNTCAIPSAAFPSYITHGAICSTGGIGSSGDGPNCGTGDVGSGLNSFANPAAVFATLSHPLLSQYNRIAYGQLNGFPYWNMDFSLGKNIAVTERYSLLFTVDAFNIFNHVVFQNPDLDLNNPTQFGVINSQANVPRQLQLGLKFIF